MHALHVFLKTAKQDYKSEEHLIPFFQSYTAISSPNLLGAKRTEIQINLFDILKVLRHHTVQCWNSEVGCF